MSLLSLPGSQIQFNPQGNNVTCGLLQDCYYNYYHYRSALMEILLWPMAPDVSPLLSFGPQGLDIDALLAQPGAARVLSQRSGCDARPELLASAPVAAMAAAMADDVADVCGSGVDVTVGCGGEGV